MSDYWLSLAYRSTLKQLGYIITMDDKTGQIHIRNLKGQFAKVTP